MFKRVLIVCVGNICRSPTAEYIFRYHLTGRGIEVESAGLGALVGKRMDETAAQIMEDHGMDGSAHRARQITEALLRESDLILGMEKSHLMAIGRMSPEASGKVFLLDKWVKAQDIPDPYRQQRPAFEHVFKMIDRGVRSWLPYL